MSGLRGRLAALRERNFRNLFVGQSVSVIGDQLSKREEVRRTGVYLLVGPDPDDSSRQLVYIGETDNVLKRLLKLDGSLGISLWPAHPS